jgi:CRP-like cAMP-binding protein
MSNNPTGDSPVSRRDFQVTNAPASAGSAAQATHRGDNGNALKRLLANRLLGALPPDEFELLLPALQPVALTAGDEDELCGPHFVYFPEDAVVSHLVVFEDGSTVEATMTGREGVVGCDALFDVKTPTHQTRVTLPGGALRMRAEQFRREFAEREALRELLFVDAARRDAQASQRGACAIRHQIESRLATWLLMMHDRAAGDELPFTQEFIARRIGSRRAGITEVACKFQELGLISYRRGSLRITDRAGLQDAACECYEVLRNIS